LIGDYLGQLITEFYQKLIMKIEIKNGFSNGKEYYEFDLWDGPEEIEHVRGFSTDLINVFTKVLEWRERIGREYEEEH
jgi:hypothetical protein